MWYLATCFKVHQSDGRGQPLHLMFNCMELLQISTKVRPACSGKLTWNHWLPCFYGFTNWSTSAPLLKDNMMESSFQSRLTCSSEGCCYVVMVCLFTMTRYGEIAGLYTLLLPVMSCTKPLVRGFKPRFSRLLAHCSTTGLALYPTRFVISICRIVHGRVSDPINKQNACA